MPEKTAVPENNVQAQALARDIARRKKEEADRRDVQMELFSDKLLTEESRARHKLIGQVFDTYWIVEFEEKMYIIDQHAAHEKVMYVAFYEAVPGKTSDITDDYTAGDCDLKLAGGDASETASAGIPGSWL